MTPSKVLTASYFCYILPLAQKQVVQMREDVGMEWSGSGGDKRVCLGVDKRYLVD